MIEAEKLAQQLDNRYEIHGADLLRDIKVMLRSQATKIEALRRDAARWNWFADVAVTGTFERAEKAFAHFADVEECTREQLDAAIDTAIERENDIQSL